MVGLGNPGREYEATRHNVGFAVVDELLARNGERLRASKRARAQICETRLEGTRAVLVKPATYMNASGSAVAPLRDFYQTPLDQLVVIHDELDLPLSSLRVKVGGSDAGNNGLKSIRASLGSGDFYRIRVGISRPSGRQNAASYVLQRFAASERDAAATACAQAADATESLVSRGLAETQNQYNC